jgi:hypothetical protein
MTTRMTKIWALRWRREKQPTDLPQHASYLGDRTLASSAAENQLSGDVCYRDKGD